MSGIRNWLSRLVNENGFNVFDLHIGAQIIYFLYREGRWPSGRADVSEPGGPGFDSSSRQPQVVAHQHLRSTPSSVLSCAWLVTMALHVHALRLGPTQPVTDFWG